LTDFDNFWHATSGKKLHANDTGFGYLTSILSLQSLIHVVLTTVSSHPCICCVHSVKCSHSLAIYNNEFILNTTHIGSETIDSKVTNTTGNYNISKSHTLHHILFITACAQNVLLQRECKWQTLTPLTNSRLNTQQPVQGSAATVLKWGGQ